MKIELTVSEKKTLRKIKKYIKDFFNSDIHRFNVTTNEKRYDFWFTYNDKEEAINWEGGFDMPKTNSFFRNQYTLIDGIKLTQNWSLLSQN